ncbi:hypothetical protein ACFQU3_10670 [Terrabacter sp. GCM10028922]|uniref:hypothetical protein n=1 Tax=Terrabacter sp. GCM10028922 TaxID=3273428 RepID=UPI0036149B64
MTDKHPAARVVISTDVTAWTPQQRDQLFAAIAKIEFDSNGSQDVDLSAAESTGWTLDAYTELMTRLLSKYGVQGMVINEACKNGSGYVDRNTVYKLGKYTDDRSLKGFTRPVNRIQKELVLAGKLPEGAADLLEPDYDPKVKSYQRAPGFRVPLEVVKLLQDHNRPKAD